MRVKYIILLSFLFVFSCSKNKIETEEIAVISSVYNNLPKIIPPPPAVDEGYDIQKSNDSKPRFLEHRYAINAQFQSQELSSNNINLFFKHKSDKLFDKVSVDSTLFSLTKKIKFIKHDKLLDKNLLDQYLGDNLLYLNQKVISREEKQKHNINAIISFSRVAFDMGYNYAAVCVDLYYDKLASSSTVYILQKINNKWVIKYTQVGEVS
jgi:hypothetical protein